MQKIQHVKGEDEWDELIQSREMSLQFLQYDTESQCVHFLKDMPADLVPAGRTDCLNLCVSASVSPLLEAGTEDITGYQGYIHAAFP